VQPTSTVDTVSVEAKENPTTFHQQTCTEEMSLGDLVSGVRNIAKNCQRNDEKLTLDQKLERDRSGILFSNVMNQTRGHHSGEGPAVRRRPTFFKSATDQIDYKRILGFGKRNSKKPGFASDVMSHSLSPHQSAEATPDPTPNQGYQDLEGAWPKGSA